MTTDPSTIARAVQALRDADRPVRILRSVAWPPGVRARFFAAGARELPVVEYPAFDPGPVRAATKAARGLVDAASPIGAWIDRLALSIERGALMLAGMGTPAFYLHSHALYGAPRSPVADSAATPLSLARTLEAILGPLTSDELGGASEARFTAADVAERMRAAAGELGDDAPLVEIVDDLSANALAGARRIRLRAGAVFNDEDLDQLIEHELMVHTVTALNGLAQTELPILAASHPGTTRMQEGLAVFAELVTGTLGPDRFERLSARVLAIAMAEDGADFLEVYRYMLERGVAPEQAFESTRRVFRGGVLTGGAPFTKDVVYLDGLLRVHAFLREAAIAGRVDCMEIAFAGKLDMEDIPALCHLRDLGMLAPPRFLPRWMRDRRWLLTHLAHAAFLSQQADFAAVRAHYSGIIEQAPVAP